MADYRRVLILGGGFAGMFTAHRLARQLADPSCIELVDDNNYFVFQPLLPEVAAGTLDAADAVTPFRQLLPKVRVAEAEVVAIDLANRQVQVVQGMRRRVRTIACEHLVLALGTRLDLSRFPGLGDHAFTMKDLSDAFRLRNHLIDCLEQADTLESGNAEDRELKRRMLTFVVIGGGLSGVEVMGEMEDMLTRALKSYPRLRRSEIRLVLVEFMDRILPELGPDLAGYAARALGRRGIEVITGMGVKSAAADTVELADGRVIRSLTVVAAIGNAPQQLLADLSVPKEKGRVVTDAYLRVVAAENVWAVGDCARIPLGGGESPPAPPTAQAAVREAEVLADNLASMLQGGVPRRTFAFQSRGQLASLGGHKGVAEVMGLQVLGWPAWLLWRMAYLVMLPGLAAKVRVVGDWLMDMLFPRNLVQVAQARSSAVRRLHFRAGDPVYEQGDHAGPVFVVETGAFERSGAAPARLGPGESFGEAGLLGERLRRHSVRALEDSTCLVMERRDFDALSACLEGVARMAGLRQGRGGG